MANIEVFLFHFLHDDLLNVADVYHAVLVDVHLLETSLERFLIKLFIGVFHLHDGLHPCAQVVLSQLSIRTCLKALYSFEYLMCHVINTLIIEDDLTTRKR